MIIDVMQISQDFCSASFTIKHKDEQIGSFSLQGKFYSPKAEIQGTIYGQPFKMVYGKMDGLEAKHPHRPYLIYKGDTLRGNVYEYQFNSGMFKNLGSDQMKIDGMVFDLFSIGLGKEGDKSPIYNRDKQVAQIDTPCVVYNELYNFKIFAEDLFASEVAILFCVYMYTNGCYQPGLKVVHSKTKTILITTDKALKEKYNPDFVKGIKND